MNREGAALARRLAAGPKDALVALRGSATQARARGHHAFVVPARLSGAAPGTAAVATLAAALATSWLGARTVDPRQIGDLGLVPALPLSVPLAVAAVNISFCLTLRRARPSTPLLLAHLGALIVILYGCTIPIQQVDSYNVVWRHAGITDYIMRTGAVAPRIDAYFNWPGFFFLAALLTKTAGLSSTLDVSKFAPIAFNLLYLPPLVLIARAGTRDRRLVWLAIWLFYLANWVGQDYFSPQGLGLFTYLAVVAALVTWFRTPVGRLRALQRWRGLNSLPRSLARGPRLARVVSPRRLPEQPVERLSPRARAGVMLVCIVCIAAEVASHQLTPFAILLAILALIVADRCSAPGLATVTAVLLATWLSFMTVGYLSGHMGQVTGSLGQLSGTVNASVGSRVAGSSGHLAVVYTRIAITAIFLALALAGFVRRLLAGEGSRSLAALALAPVLLAALQAYGGEIAMRVYLFALPFTAFFAAAALLPSYGRRFAWTRTGALVVVCLVLVAGFGYARYGNERINLFSRGEVQAVEHMYGIAPRGALLVAGSAYLPWKAHDYANYDYELVSSLKQSVFSGVKAPPTGPDRVPAPEVRSDGAAGRGGQGKMLATELAAFMQARVTEKHLPAGFLILTRTQFAAERLLGPTGAAPLAALAPEVKRSRRFRKVFDNGEGQVFQLVTRQRGGGR